ncbi:MAG: DUF898 family protein [Actinomycetota bacterium]|nr:DUF898 family protein [Actinomycetota bacterium]
MVKSRSFTFDGGALTYWGTQLLALLITLVTFGFGYPFGLVLKLRWRSKHTRVNGIALAFNGSALGLIGHWLLWWLLTLITVGFYSFWVSPQLNKWIVEHTDFDSSSSLPASISINGVIYVQLQSSTSPQLQLEESVSELEGQMPVSTLEQESTVGESKTLDDAEGAE